jgi:hypothetical protein
LTRKCRAALVSLQRHRGIGARKSLSLRPTGDADGKRDAGLLDRGDDAVRDLHRVADASANRREVQQKCEAETIVPVRVALGRGRDQIQRFLDVTFV